VAAAAAAAAAAAPASFSPLAAQWGIVHPRSAQPLLLLNGTCRQQLNIATELLLTQVKTAAAASGVACAGPCGVPADLLYSGASA
jgi:hypothetical protein